MCEISFWRLVLLLWAVALVFFFGGFILCAMFRTGSRKIPPPPMSMIGRIRNAHPQ